ncbi:MAG: hypothetical protein RSC76_04740 [Oscillospiraceae bacterium]
MILQTYQSMTVLAILKKEEIYRAKPSISYKGAYAALVEMLHLHCECPIFAVVKGRKQNTGGRVSGVVKFTLDVPDDRIKFTEYNVWADFLYAFRFTKPHDYTRLKADCEEMTHRRYTALLHNLQTPKPLGQYRYPQAILEEIRPEWLVNYQLIPAGATKGAITLAEKIANIFRR